MNIKRLKELKDKLKHESDLSKIWLFYMDHFADHEAFMELGQPAENDFLDAVVRQICQQMFGSTIPVRNFLLIHIPEHQLFHGPFDVGGRIGGMIYFENIKVGLIAVSMGFPSNDGVKYSRFSKPIKLKSKPPERSDLN
jgi:hypothetical protein